MAKTKILIVEDEYIIVRDLLNCLKNLGYSVAATAVSGREAIHKARKVQPDLVLMDIVLKGDMNGIEAAEKIRSRFNIPILYLTAYLDGKRLEKALAAQPYKHISKPFEIWELQTSIQAALCQH